MDKDASEQFFAHIGAICSAYNWVIGINVEKDGLDGIIMGTQDYVTRVIEENESFAEYSMYSPPDPETSEGIQ
jgi:hypothetical protein